MNLDLLHSYVLLVTLKHVCSNFRCQVLIKPAFWAASCSPWPPQSPRMSECAKQITTQLRLASNAKITTHVHHYY